MSRIRKPAAKAPALSPAAAKAIIAAARKAGEASAAAARPVPMVVGTPVNPFSNALDRSKPVEIVEGGVCGFAWINLKPARGPLAAAFKDAGGRPDSYEGGLRLWVGGFGQSMARKEAYAQGFAESLRASVKRLTGEDVRCYAQSRMD